MTAPLTDPSGRIIRPDRAAGSSSAIDRVIAVPPVRQFPTEQSTELLWTAYKNLPAAGAAFVPLTDPVTGNDFNQMIGAANRGRIDAMLISCYDMVTAANPYLFFKLRVKGQDANAWGYIPVYPRSGTAQLSIEPAIDLDPATPVQLLAMNTDPANSHHVAWYLHGWQWAKSLVQS